MSTKSCVYCGRPADTADHVPPKGLFPKPRPSNLSTVPSCSACNNGASKDDEYFRQTLALRANTEENTPANQALDAVLRSLARDDAVGLRRSLEGSIRRRQSPHGTTNELEFKVDVVRIARVVERIVRGFYYVEMETALPSDAKVKVVLHEDLMELGAEARQHFAEKIVPPLLNSPIRGSDRKVCTYRFAPVQDVPFASSWGLVFFGDTTFVALTMPPASIMSPLG